MAHIVLVPFTWSNTYFIKVSFLKASLPVIWIKAIGLSHSGFVFVCFIFCLRLHGIWGIQTSVKCRLKEEKSRGEQEQKEDTNNKTDPYVPEVS